MTELFAARIKDRAGIVLAKAPAEARLRLVIGTVAFNESAKIDLITGFQNESGRSFDRTEIYAG